MTMPDFNKGYVVYAAPLKSITRDYDEINLRDDIWLPKKYFKLEKWTGAALTVRKNIYANVVPKFDPGYYFIREANADNIKHVEFYDEGNEMWHDTFSFQTVSDATRGQKINDMIFKILNQSKIPLRHVVLIQNNERKINTKDEFKTIKNPDNLYVWASGQWISVKELVKLNIDTQKMFLDKFVFKEILNNE